MHVRGQPGRQWLSARSRSGARPQRSSTPAASTWLLGSSRMPGGAAFSFASEGAAQRSPGKPPSRMCRLPRVLEGSPRGACTACPEYSRGVPGVPVPPAPSTRGESSRYQP
jgi:hypothetical protein